MVLDEVFDRFVKESPVTVMMRAVLEFVLPLGRLDELFRIHAKRQYEDELLFSTAVKTLSLVVHKSRDSVNSAYKACRESFTVSVTSLYNKLKGTEPQVSRAIVCDSAQRLAPVIRSLKAQLPPLLNGYRAKILDGNHLTGTDHRLTETRTLNSSPLPGQALVVLDPQLRLMIDVFPCEDAYAQERSLLDAVLKTVEKNDLWIGDRNFCGTNFLFGIRDKQAVFVIRQHSSTLWDKTPIGRRRRIGRSETGTVYERQLRIRNPQESDPQRQMMILRRITIVLDKPTRNGETVIHLLTNIPEEHADAIKIAEIYVKRWTIESAFQELEQALRSEVNTLCYPKAALLAFCVAVFTYNILSTMKAAMRSAHRDPSLLTELSGYYLAGEISSTYGGMMIAIPPHYWETRFGTLSAAEFATTLQEIAQHVKVDLFKKNKRGPKKPPPKRTGGFREKHVSTARLLAARKNPKQHSQDKTKQPK